MERKYNTRSPGVKRLMREAIELRNPTPMYYAQPLEDNLFEWHFTILGPQGTEFEGGHYHGRISLPTEYPMKPPSIIMLTPNGRFELFQKICLSASAYHPELWQPSWSIRTVLLAMIGFMPTEGVGAVGSMDCSPEERKRLARKSLEWRCSVCGMLNADALPAVGDGDEAGEQAQTMAEAADIVTQMAFKSEDEVKAQKKQLSAPQVTTAASSEATPTTTADPAPQLKPATPTTTETPPTPPEPCPSAAPVPEQQQEEEEEGVRQRPIGFARTAPVVTNMSALPSFPAGATEPPHQSAGPCSLLLIFILLLAIAALVTRRLMASQLPQNV